ncbi:MAG TPA: AraC family transcriptional regulator [Chthoniobacterales bacterium]
MIHPLTNATGSVCRRAVGHLLNTVDCSQFMLRIPQLRDHVVEYPGMHFHFSPDFVIALSGRCRLEFIHENFVLEPYEMAVIPSGIPHREVPMPTKREPFESLVISIYNQTISVQHQKLESEDGMLQVRSQFFDSTKDQVLNRYLEEMAETYHSPEHYDRLGIKGLLMAYLSTLLGAVKHADVAPPVEKLKITQTKRHVLDNLCVPELSVKFLADLQHCSADYLSHLFHKETGQRLVAYINQERINAAMILLRGSSLTISEVAYAVGFESQSYFSHVFREVTLKTPMEYRRTVEHAFVELDGRPRTVFAETNGEPVTA